MERESLEMDVVFVGAGPANLSGALHLARLVAEHNDAIANGTSLDYTIYRRPVVSPGARETTLPAGIVIDLTGWNAPTIGLRPERSRLPVDPYTNYVDIMIAPNGQVVQGGAGTSGGDINALAPAASQPFYHFWLTDRQDVVAPLETLNVAPVLVTATF